MGVAAQKVNQNLPNLGFKRSYQIETRPLSACYRSAKPLTGFILGYAHFTEEELEHAVLKLKDALEQTLG